VGYQYITIEMAFLCVREHMENVGDICWKTLLVECNLNPIVTIMKYYTLKVKTKLK